MDFTREQALELSLAAGDTNMRNAGRTEWNDEDVACARTVFERLKPVQKMDETETDDVH